MSAFSLKPYEALIPGVQYREGTLRLRPTWAATSLDLYGAVIGLFVVAIGIATHNLLVVAAGFTCCALCLPYLRCRVVAEGRTIRVVNKWRSFTLNADDIKALKVQEFRPSSFWPFRAPGTLWPRTLTECTLFRRDNSTVRCDALVGLPRASDTEDPSPIETKATILSRWIECMSTSTPTPS